jgi:hypothetical protein
MTMSIYEAIENFCQKKKSIDASSRFNVTFFEENGPNYLQDFTLNPEHIILTLKSLEPVIVGGNIGGGIFVGISFIIQAFKAISEKAFRLIVFSDSGTPKISPIYLPVLDNLIEQVKDMPFFIDIIRIKTNDPFEDDKLLKLVEKCGGGIHYIKKLKELPKLGTTLASKKRIAARSIEDGKYMIPPESQMFFINLAEDLYEVSEQGTCSICFQKKAKDLYKCNNCGNVAHQSCWAQWAPKSSIGIPNVFRCFSCYNLIRVEQDYIERVKLTKALQRDVRVKVIDTQEYLESLESKEGPRVVQAESMLSTPSGVKDVSKIDTTKVEKRKVELAPDEVKFVLCPHCFKMITTEYKICPACHKTIEE